MELDLGLYLIKRNKMGIMDGKWREDDWGRIA